MERSDEEVGAQESPRGSAWQVRWRGPQRGQTARQPEERAQGRVGQKPAKDARLSTQCAAPPSWSPQEIKAVIALIRGRFGYFAIGLGEVGIRYRRGGAEDTQLVRSRGLISGEGDRLTITEAGIQALGFWKPLPTGSELVDYWRTGWEKAERLILEEVAAKAGYEVNSGGFNNALGRLRTLELVDGRANSEQVTIFRLQQKLKAEI